MNKREVRNLREVSVSSILFLPLCRCGCIIALTVITFSRSITYYLCEVDI